MNIVELTKYDNSWYKPGGTFYKRMIWYFFNLLFVKSGWLPFSGFKLFLLRLFGAKIGKGVVIKPCVNIKYPWNLVIGNFTWIGEEVWIDNLAKVEIGSNCCLSQGAMLLCGNHNYKKATFDLMIGEIKIEDGCWVGARSLVTGGVTMHTHSILCVNSFTSKDLEAFGIYLGTPAVKVKERIIES